MEYLYLFLAMFFSALLSIMSSLFGKRNSAVQNTSPLYSLFVVASACVCWGISCVYNAEFDFRVIGYSALYGAFYSVAMIGMFQAYRSGSTSLTAFIKQLSLICVAFWGFVFWNNDLTVTIGVGLILVVVALLLCFAKNKAQKKSVVSLKWAIYAAMLLLGNAGCSIVQKYQQMSFDVKTQPVFMLFGVLTALIVCAFLYFRKDRCKIKNLKKGSVAFPIIGGISSSVLNLLILLLMRSPIEESIIFPGIAVGGLLFTLLFSLIAYHEKLTLRQWLGLGVGAVALVFLNL